MRIIAEKNGSSQWWAWWADEPLNRVHSTSRFRAVEKLLKRSNHHAIAVENLSIDLKTSRGDHVEMVIKTLVWTE